MKKSTVSTLFYALFLLLGHGSNNGVNAKNLGLNPYDGSKMKNGTQYADCALDSANKARVQNMRDAINSY